MASGTPRPTTASGAAPRGGIVLLGFALGGFIDGILLHQVLQWHHLLSAVRDGRIPLASQIAADGLFHLLMYALTVLACWRLWRGRDRLAGSPGRDVLVLALAGFVLWQVVDVVVFHWIARIHRVRMDTDVPLAWDLGWFTVFGLVPALIAGGIARGRRGGGPGATHMAASIAVVTLAAGVWAARGPVPGDEILVLVAPGVRPAEAIAALGDAGGRVTWVSDDASVWAVRDLRHGTAWSLLARGAVAVGAAPVGLGCASWSVIGARS